MQKICFIVCCQVSASGQIQSILTNLACTLPSGSESRSPARMTSTDGRSSLPLSGMSAIWSPSSLMSPLRVPSTCLAKHDGTKLQLQEFGPRVSSISSGPKQLTSHPLDIAKLHTILSTSAPTSVAGGTSAANAISAETLVSDVPVTDTVGKIESVVANLPKIVFKEVSALDPNLEPSLKASPCISDDASATETCSDDSMAPDDIASSYQASQCRSSDSTLSQQSVPSNPVPSTSPQDIPVAECPSQTEHSEPNHPPQSDPQTPVSRSISKPNKASTPTIATTRTRRVKTPRHYCQ